MRNYTEAVLNTVCPKCKAKGGKCLEKTKTGMGGSHYIEEPHIERVHASGQ